MEKKVKIFFPLDVSRELSAQELINNLAQFVDVFKVGLELVHSIGTPAAIALVKTSGKEVFADVKLSDIPNTVKCAAKAIAQHGVSYFNVMANGGQAMMEAAIEGAEQGAREAGIAMPKIIAVTVLTHLEIFDLTALGIVPTNFDIIPCTPEDEQRYITEVVLQLAEIAVNAGVNCLLCSPLEVAALHNTWSYIEIICPGIRLPSSPPDDQKRTATPGEAVKAGATGLVIGRPIRNPPEGKTRQDVLREIQEDIAWALF